MQVPHSQHRVVALEPDRRIDPRHAVQMRTLLSVVDGPLAGQSFEIQTRNLSNSGICFLLKQELRVGQHVRIELRGATRLYEVVRSRLLSNGKYEMAVTARDKAI